MPLKRILILALILFFTLSLSACFSMAEDVTPPPGYQPAMPQQATAEPDRAVYPMLPPDAARGEPIYIEKCAPCHGDSGLGDGPDADALPNPVTALGSLAVVRESTPANWYNVVANGRMEKFMPPFSSLSVSDRWDVLAYVYTLSMRDDDLAQGKLLYEENCLLCHGERGRGDGPEAGSLEDSPIDFTDQAFMGMRSAGDLFQAITAGVGSRPGYAALSESDRWALTSYLRTLSFAAPSGAETNLADSGDTAESYPPPYPEPTEEVPEAPSEPVETPAEGLGMALVDVVHFSGGEIPTGLEITLYGYDNMSQVYSETLAVNGENSVVFTDVPMPAERMLFAAVTHDELTFGSQIATLDGETNLINLQVDYYDATQDISVLQADRLHVFFGFENEDLIEVFVLYVFSNTSDQVVMGPEDDMLAIEFALPPGASNLQVDESMQLSLMRTAKGFGILNIYPSETAYQIVFSYDMPYEKNKLDLPLPVELDTTAVIVMAPEDGIKIKSERLMAAGTRDVEGISYALYNGSNFSLGDTLMLSISGQPKSGTSFLAPEGGTDKTGLVIGIGAFGLALIGAGVYLWQKNRIAEDDDLVEIDGLEIGAGMAETTEDLMDAIIALDDLFQAGELPEAAYLKRREELKSCLRKMMEDES